MLNEATSDAAIPATRPYLRCLMPVATVRRSHVLPRLLKDQWEARRLCVLGSCVCFHHQP